MTGWIRSLYRTKSDLMYELVVFVAVRNSIARDVSAWSVIPFHNLFCTTID